MVEPISIIGLTISLCHVVKSIYHICKDLPNVPKQIEELCLRLLALQDVLSRVSAAMQFELTNESSRQVRRFASIEFQKAMSVTGKRIKNLEEELAPPTKDKWTQAAKQRISWVFQKSRIEECANEISWCIDYFGQVLTSENNALLQKLYGGVMSLSQRSTLELRQELSTWLGTPNYYAQHAFYLDSRQPGTGSWFTKGPLQDWLDEPTQTNKVLWLDGKSGGGKSLLACHAIESTMSANDQTTSSQLTILYFYCTSSDVSSQSVIGVLSAFVHQMCNRRPEELWSRVHVESQKPAAGSRDARQGASLDQVKQLFRDFTLMFPRLCIFLDAVNENPESDLLLYTLAQVISSHPSMMKLCIFSKPEVPSQHCAALGVHRIHIDQTQQTADFKVYVESSLRSNASLAELNDDLKSSVTQKLLAKAHGSFKWVECMIQSLAEQPTPKDVRRALELLPPTLDRHYRETLTMVASIDRMHVRRLLRWLVVQIRPLTIQELSEAVALDANSNLPVLDEEQRPMKGKVEHYLRVLRSLVHYDADTQTVRLAHPSVREFLISTSWQSDRDLADLTVGDALGANDVILRACLWYLLQEPFRSGAFIAEAGEAVPSMTCPTPSLAHPTPSPVKPAPSLAKLQTQSTSRTSWSLYDYCAQAWPRHFELANQSVNTRKYALRLVNSYSMPGGGNYSFWLQQYSPNYIPKSGQSWKMLPPLHLAASRGWLALTQLILCQDRKELNASAGESNLTPLLRACVYSQEPVIRYLLQMGAQIPPADAKRFSAYILPKLSLPLQQLLTSALAK